METTIRIYKIKVWGGKLYGSPLKTAAIAVIDKKYYWQGVTDKNSYTSTNAEDNLANAFESLKRVMTK
jgi:hypothetical protein